MHSTNSSSLPRGDVRALAKTRGCEANPTQHAMMHSTNASNLHRGAVREKANTNVLLFPAAEAANQRHSMKVMLHNDYGATQWGRRSIFPLHRVARTGFLRDILPPRSRVTSKAIKGKGWFFIRQEAKGEAKWKPEAGQPSQALAKPAQAQTTELNGT